MLECVRKLEDPPMCPPVDGGCGATLGAHPSDHRVMEGGVLPWGPTGYLPGAGGQGITLRASQVLESEVPLWRLLGTCLILEVRILLWKPTMFCGAGHHFGGCVLICVGRLCWAGPPGMPDGASIYQINRVWDLAPTSTGRLGGGKAKK